MGLNLFLKHSLVMLAAVSTLYTSNVDLLNANSSFDSSQNQVALSNISNENEEIQTLSINQSVKYYNPLTQTINVTDATVIESGMTELKDEWYVLNSDFETYVGLKITGDVNIILADGASLTANYGVEVNEGNSLTIWGQSKDYENNGRIIANGRSDGAGIGGIKGKSSGVITINGGNIRAQGANNDGAGIGGGDKGTGTVIINGGYIYAYGGILGAGIGGGLGGTGNVTITGGIINAYGGSGSATGIGGGCDGAGNVKISGGKIEAHGYDRAVGIGGGQGKAGNVTITGGEVWAAGGSRNEFAIGDGTNDTEIEDKGTFSTGENGNAIIHGSVSDQTGKDNWEGIVDNTVYGDFVLDHDLDLYDSVIVPEGSTFTVSEDVTFRSLGSIDNKGTITNNGTMENYGKFTNEGKLINDGTTLNQGKFENTVDGAFQNNNRFTNDGELTNYGITLNQGKLTNEGLTLNQGNLENTSRGIIQNNNEFTNDGKLTNDGTTLNQGKFENTNGGLFQNNKEFTNEGYVTNSGKITNEGVIQNTSGSNFQNQEDGSIDNNKDFINDSGSNYQSNGTVQNKSYTVKFVSEYDAQISEITVEYGKKITYLDYTKEGYTLVGWYLDEEFSEKWDFDNDVIPSHDITLYAKLDINSYKVSFESDEDVKLPEDIIKNYGSVLKLPKVPEKVGYRGKWLVDGKEVEEITIKDNITVKAVYTINSYTITFISNNEVISESKVNFGGKVIQPKISNKSGYEFGGWYLDKKFLNKWDFNTDIVDNITLYAKWTKKEGVLTEDVEISSNIFDAKLSMLPGEMAEAVLNDNDRKLLKEGKNIQVVLDINDVTISLDDEKLLTEKALNYELYKYFDIEILKIINSSKESVSETLKPIQITINIPDDNIEGREYTILRLHDGVVTMLKDLDDNDKTYTFESDKFSIYALAYKNEDSSIDTNEDTKKESENNHGVIKTVLLITTLITIFIIIIIRKKNNKNK